MLVLLVWCIFLFFCVLGVGDCIYELVCFEDDEVVDDDRNECVFVVVVDEEYIVCDYECDGSDGFGDWICQEVEDGVCYCFNFGLVGSLCLCGYWYYCQYGIGECI